MDNIIYKYIFSKKAEAIKNQAESFIKKSNDTYELYSDAIILPAKNFNDYDVSHGRGGVVDSNGEYIKASFTRARVDGKYEPEEFDYSDSKVVYCGYFHKAWGHFLTEVVSRLWYVLKDDKTVDFYVFIDDIDGKKQFTGNYYEFFRLLGIEKKVILLNKPTKFKEVVLPFSGFDYGHYYTDQFVKMYEYIVTKGISLYKGEAYKKVFFSKRRQEISIMSNLNEKFIDKYFEKNGYKIFYPEQLSLIETIGIMQNAKYFAGISSSLAHNQLFGHSDQTMISVEKQAFYNPYQVFVAKITGCKCVFVDACRHIFTVNASGPFIFDYTEHMDKFALDYNMSKSKPMSNLKYRRLFKKYLIYYFNFDCVMPPDYMYRQYVLDMSREMYDDTIEKGKIFHMSLYQRMIVRLKKEILKLKNR